MQERPWQPTASIEVLKKRAAFMAAIRAFFSNRGYLEVETPYMANCGVSDVHLANIKALFRDKPYFLQTSPEYHMKRLLAAGSGPIFQIARVFRDDEYGRWHNPEFTMLEWYQLDVDHWYLIAEMEFLFKHLFNSPNFHILTYEQAFQEACQINPLIASEVELHQVCQAHDLGYVLKLDEPKDQFLHLLMGFVVEPYLAKQYAQPVVVHDFPASQACLARVEGNVAKRFEVYWKGIELANGFYELTDEQAQRARFEADLHLRSQMGLPNIDIDEQLLGALRSGLPPCSGVALGLDRLFAAILQTNSISEVMSFAFPSL